MASEAYWERRKATLMFDEMEIAESAADEIADIYAKGSLWLGQQMDRIFEKYRDKFGMSEQEARDMMRRMRDPSDIDEMMDMLRRRQDSEMRRELLQKLEAAAYRYRINRLKSLQDDTVRLLSGIAKRQEGITKNALQTIGRDGFYHEIYDLQQRTGVVFPFNKVNTKAIDQVMRSRWSGENYSSRIWKNTDELARILKEELLLSIAVGRTDRDTARVVQEKMQSGSMQARRLIRTESNYIYTQMDMRGYEEAGIEEYLYLAILDLRTSKICQKLNGQIFKVKDQKPGKNCPPMHPWCRSTTIAVISRELLKDMKRRARNPVTGEVTEIPMTMGYQEWYEKYVEGKDISEKETPKNRNLTREQFERYRERGVGPETYEEFLKAKADPETWENLKGEYRKAGVKQSEKNIVSKNSLNRARIIRSKTDLMNVSKSSILNMTSTEEIVRHFADIHGIHLVGFNKGELLSIQAPLAGYDDMLYEFPELKGKITEIRLNMRRSSNGNIDLDTGISEIGKTGLYDYGTGVHESSHMLDKIRSGSENHSYANSVFENARRNLKLRKNSKKYMDLVYKMVGLVKDSRIYNDPVELFAFGVETAKGNVDNILADEIYRLVKEG